METTILVSKYQDDMIQTRRQFHQNPELSQKEFKTTAYIKSALREIGVEICDIGLETGVIAMIRGGHKGKTLAIRADMDALPMQENTGLPFASVNDGVCHSCGHDIHTTCLLYAAKALQEIHEELVGDVMLIFQPAEENLYGARSLVAHDFRSVAVPDMYLSLHCSPEFDAGKIAVRSGPANASSNFFDVRIKGKGGHAAHPERFVDPIMIASYIITALQTIVSRENYPVYPAVVSICKFHAGTTANNIVPAYADFGGTIRSLDREAGLKLEDSITKIIRMTAEGMRAEAEVTWGEQLPMVYNDERVIELVRGAAEKTIGADHITAIPNPSMGSDDFAVLVPYDVPGAQFRIGSGDDSIPNSRNGLHNPQNIFDERALMAGTTVLVQAARDYLS